MKNSQIIEEISIILTELDARENSNNCLSCLQKISWDDLCKMGSNLFEQLRHAEEKEKER